ncbi:MAG TPA: hypothetical protein VK761_04825 [Solirubrobacteraceae bacterium]|nr:hypothetical protein [Solirubrobacteraceae bacterium]
MGLLDDAIREHLELKRQRGADPSEVAREQHEALDPVPREPDALLDDDAPVAAAAPTDDAAPFSDAVPSDAPEAAVMAGGVPEDMPDDLADSPASEIAAGPVGGETQELDMRSVLDGDGDGNGEGAAAADPADASASPQAGDGESLEWEMPGEHADESAFDEQQADEDVLEETPEFLRDTPEQERLWFEQRPPRDFDFDK